MLTKLKTWLFGRVIFTKVLGKFAKHGAGVIVGFLFGPKLAPVLGPVLEGMNLTEGQVEAGLIVAFTALVGAAWNFIEHRWVK